MPMGMMDPKKIAALMIETPEGVSQLGEHEDQKDSSLAKEAVAEAVLKAIEMKDKAALISAIEDMMIIFDSEE